MAAAEEAAEHTEPEPPNTPPSVLSKSDIDREQESEHHSTKSNENGTAKKKIRKSNSAEEEVLLPLPNEEDEMIGQQAVSMPQATLSQQALGYYGSLHIQAPMNTPDDPVIHSSPPSLRALSTAGPSPLGAGGYGAGTVSDSRTSSCDSPGDDGGPDSASRRTKSCRVCGDHATGYNFNVITCESCKAFFRRNALRPKEFKCPYSDDCDINSVSRRFCQKCRLRKCFTVGMKKEWILNEEQLRRRKNSRLNNLANQAKQRQIQAAQQVAQASLVQQHQQLKSMGSVSTELPFLSTPRTDPSTPTSLVSPASTFVSSPLSVNPISPTTLSSSLGNDYEPNMLMQQRLAQQRLAVLTATSRPTAVSLPGLPTVSPPSAACVAVDPVRNQVTMSMEEYKQLVMAAKRSPGDFPTPPGSVEEPSLKRFSTDIKPYTANITTQSLAPETTAYNVDAGLQVVESSKANDIGSGMMQQKMSAFFETTIMEALSVESPEGHQAMTDVHAIEVRVPFQLNQTELRALDVVRSAFSGMNDPMDPGTQKMAFMKDDKSPTDIMNIMDITMRRLVKVAKKLPEFNSISNDGKFQLLKGSMIEMLTVRGVTRFDEDANAWRTPMLPAQYQVSINMFDSLQENVGEEQKSRFLQFFKTFNEDLRKNDLAIDLIMLIVLFTPRPNLDDKDRSLVERHHNDYYALLHRYLESIYGEASRRFHDSIPRALDMLKIIAGNASSLFVGKVDTSHAEALPKEFFPVE